MASVGWATLDVIPSFKGLQGQLDSGTSGPLRNAGAKGGTLFGDAAGRSASSRFGTVFRRGAKVAALGALAGAAAAIKFGGDALEEAREAQKVGAQTDAVIKSTGRAARVTAKDVGRLSGRLSDMAGIDDELIQSGANVLLTFKNVRNEAGKGNDIFSQATEAALDMSVALGTDLKGANIQLGKALNDPIKGMSTLGRAGVQFSEDQKKAIKAMVESGDVLGAQKLILKELDDQFKGSARAQATEADKLSVAYGNLKEEVGTALIPVMDDLAVFLRKKGIPAAQDFFGWIQDDGIPAVQDFAREAKPVIEVVKDLADVFGDLPTSGKIASLGGALAGGLVIKHQFAKIFERGGVANPMFVVVTNPGVGGGGGLFGGKGGGVAKGGVAGAAATWGSRAATFFKSGLTKGLWVTAGLTVADQIWRAADGNNTAPMKWAYRVGDAIHEGFISKLGNQNTTKTQSNGEANPWASLYKGDPKKVTERINTVMDATRAKAAGLGTELDLVGARKINPTVKRDQIDRANAALAEFINKQIDAGRPVTPYINTTSIERAIALARTLDAELRPHAVPTAGVDNGAGYMHGGTPDINPRAGVLIDQRGSTIVAHDYDDFVSQSQKKAQRAGLGGRPNP